MKRVFDIKVGDNVICHDPVSPLNNTSIYTVCQLVNCVSIRLAEHPEATYNWTRFTKTYGKLKKKDDSD